MAPKGQITFTLVMEAGSADKAQQRLEANFRKMEASARTAARGQQFLATSINKLWRSALYGVASYASVSAVSGAIRGVTQEIERHIEKRSQFEKSLTPLLSSGDNIKNIGAVRKEIMGLGVTYRQSFDEMAKAKYNFESGSSNLPKRQRDQLMREAMEFSEAMGTTPQASMDMMLASYQNAKEELKDMNQLQSKLVYTLEKSKAGVQSFADGFGDLVAAGKSAGYQFDEIAAAFVAGSRLSGNDERFRTGMRGVLLTISDKEKLKDSGIKLTGGLVEQFQQLDALLKKNPQKFGDLFDTEQRTAAAQITASVKDLNEAMRDLSNIVDQDYAGGLVEVRWADPESAATFLAESRKMYAEMKQLQVGVKGLSYAETRDYGTERMREQLGGFPLVPDVLGPLAGWAYPKYAREAKMEHSVSVAEQMGDHPAAELLAKQVVGSAREEEIPWLIKRLNDVEQRLGPEARVEAEHKLNKLYMARPAGFDPENPDFSKEEITKNFVLPETRDFVRRFLDAQIKGSVEADRPKLMAEKERFDVTIAQDEVEQARRDLEDAKKQKEIADRGDIQNLRFHPHSRKAPGFQLSDLETPVYKGISTSKKSAVDYVRMRESRVVSEKEIQLAQKSEKLALEMGELQSAQAAFEQAVNLAKNATLRQTTATDANTEALRVRHESEYMATAASSEAEADPEVAVQARRATAAFASPSRPVVNNAGEIDWKGMVFPWGGAATKTATPKTPVSSGTATIDGVQRNYSPRENTGPRGRVTINGVTTDYAPRSAGIGGGSMTLDGVRRDLAMQAPSREDFMSINGIVQSARRSRPGRASVSMGGRTAEMEDGKVLGTPVDQWTSAHDERMARSRAHLEWVRRKNRGESIGIVKGNAAEQATVYESMRRKGTGGGTWAEQHEDRMQRARARLDRQRIENRTGEPGVASKGTDAKATDANTQATVALTKAVEQLSGALSSAQPAQASSSRRARRMPSSTNANFGEA